MEIALDISQQPNDPKEVIFLSEHHFLSASSDGTLTATHSDGSPSFSRTIDLPPGVNLRSLGAYKEQLACGQSDGRIIVWTFDLQKLDKERLEICPKHIYNYHLEGEAPAPVTSIAFTDDSQHLVAGDLDGYIVVWYAGGIEHILSELSSGQGAATSDDAGRPCAQVIFHRPVITHKLTANLSSGSGAASLAMGTGTAAHNRNADLTASYGNALASHLDSQVSYFDSRASYWDSKASYWDCRASYWDSLASYWDSRV
ncbi:hypothetical protein AAF712_015901 [Marasmius tenuissimus]|uniref:Uncharacterized protein n=1 Tax=Marasmius tenuissimus TaxID=585030 RepID=A0ABR2Z714_9AGAR